MADGHGTTSWTYDRLGRVTQVGQPGSGAVAYTYDAVGNRTSVTAGGKTVSYAYTATNALASVTDWASRTTAYSYDDAGQPASVAYPNTIASSYTIDRAGRVTNLAYTRSGSALAAFGYTFNGEGQRMTETSPQGTTGYTYDALGRLTGTTYPDTPAETFGYDAVGNRTSRTSSGATTTYAYNDANELASTTTAGSTSTYAYDQNGNRTSVVVPPPPDTTAPTVPANPAASATASNEVTVSWTASTDDRGVTGYLVYRNSTLVGLVSGAVTSFVDRTTAPSTAYSYTVAAIDAAANASAQSGAANVTTPSGSPGTDTTPPSTPTDLTGTPVAAGRIDLSWTASTDNVGVAGYNVYRDAVKLNTVPVGSTSYSDTGLAPGVSHTYTVTAVDAAANESAASTSWSGAAGSGALTTTYSYDPENRLTQLASGGQTIGTYAYDGAGDRVSKTAAGVTTAYTLDLASGLPQVLTETAGSAVTAYAYAGGPLELDRSGATNWYLTDTLGSVRLVTDSTGASPATYAYSAFGSTRASTGTLANEVRFSGERTDTESGLEFLRARTYDPSAGTFLQRDTWGITATDSQSIDAYAYTANNPINAVDPSGHCAYEDHYSGCQGNSSGTDMSTSVYEAKKDASRRGGPPSTTITKSDSTPVGGMARYSTSFPLTPTYVPIDPYGDYVQLELNVTYKGGWSGSSEPPITIHTDGKDVVIGTPNGTFNLAEPLKSGPVMTVATGQTDVGGHWSASSTSVSSTLPKTNGWVTTADASWTQTFQTGASNGAIAELDASVTAHLASGGCHSRIGGLWAVS